MSSDLFLLNWIIFGLCRHVASHSGPIIEAHKTPRSVRGKKEKSKMTISRDGEVIYLIQNPLTTDLFLPFTHPEQEQSCWLLIIYKLNAGHEMCDPDSGTFPANNIWSF